jgi:hypothetical protein
MLKHRTTSLLLDRLVMGDVLTERSGDQAK